MNGTPGPAPQTKIFGLRIGVDPKIMAGGLAAVAALFIWFNLSGSDDEGHTANTGTSAVRVRPATPVNRAPVIRRGNAVAKDRGILSMKPVDPTRGDIDPTLRLSLLDQLQAVQYHEGGRNLFEDGPVAITTNLPPVPNGPKMMPKPVITAPVIAAQDSAPVAMPVNIPFKYYGFVKPASKTESNRGFFMEGDNVLVGIEGDVLKSHYLIVSLTPTSARIEDTQARQGKDLMVAPEAVAQ